MAPFLNCHTAHQAPSGCLLLRTWSLWGGNVRLLIILLVLLSVSAAIEPLQGESSSTQLGNRSASASKLLCSVPAGEQLLVSCIILATEDPGLTAYSLSGRWSSSFWLRPRYTTRPSRIRRLGANLCVRSCPMYLVYSQSPRTQCAGRLCSLVILICPGRENIHGPLLNIVHRDGT